MESLNRWFGRTSPLRKFELHHKQNSPSEYRKLVHFEQVPLFPQGNLSSYGIHCEKIIIIIIVPKPYHKDLVTHTTTIESNRTNMLGTIAEVSYVGHVNRVDG